MGDLPDNGAVGKPGPAHTVRIPAIEVRGARKTYREPLRRSSIAALDGVDLRIERGEVFGLVGPNGAGKSTLLLSIAGMLSLDEGEILLHGLPLAVAGGAAIGYAPERGAFEETATVKEVLRTLAACRGLPAHEAGEAVAHVLDGVELSEYGSRRVRSLSRGMGQRLALAQAILGGPQVVLLDETLSGVDPVVHRRICAVVVQLAAGGTSVVLSSHDLAAVEELATRVAVMNRGQVSGILTASDYPRPGALRERFFELLGAPGVEATRRSLAG